MSNPSAEQFAQRAFDVNLLDERQLDSVWGEFGTRNIPLDEFDAGQDKMNKFKGKPLIAVCDSGISSNKVVQALRRSGFESAYGLKGGMNAWGQAGLPVVTGKKTKSKKG